MKKKKSNINSDDEIITKTITLLTLHLRDTILLFADFYDKQCKLIREEFDNLIDNEPPKIFRKAHKNMMKHLKSTLMSVKISRS